MLNFRFEVEYKSKKQKPIASLIFYYNQGLAKMVSYKIHYEHQHYQRTSIANNRDLFTKRNFGTNAGFLLSIPIKVSKRK